MISKIDLSVFSEMSSWKFGAGSTGVSYLVGPDHLLRTEYKNEVRHVSGLDSLKSGKKFESPAVNAALTGKDGLEVAAKTLSAESEVLKEVFSKLNVILAGGESP